MYNQSIFILWPIVGLSWAVWNSVECGVDLDEHGGYGGANSDHSPGYWARVEEVHPNLRYSTYSTPEA